MNIIHLYDGHEKVYDGRGSVPGVVWNMARETAAAGHDVTVIERQWAGLDPTAAHEGVRFDRLDLPTGADEPWTRVPYEMVEHPPALLRLIGDRTAFAAAALRRLRSLEFDVLHVHLPFAANVIATVAPWLRRKMVYTAHLGELRLNAIQDGAGNDATATDTAETDGLSVPSVLQRVSPDIYLARRAAATTALNPTIAERVIESGAPERSVRVVPNGVDVERFRSVSEADTQRVQDSYDLTHPVVLFVGTVMPRKGVVELVEAMERVVEQASDEKPMLVIAGEADLDAEYTSRVQERIADCGLEDHVRQVGFVPEADLPALYDLASVVAIPSFEEGFGMTAIEAMAAGTGVVGTRVGSIPEILAGDLGRVVDPGAVGQLADGIGELLAAPPNADRLQARADAYAWERVAEAVIETYAEVAGRPGTVSSESTKTAEGDLNQTETGATQ